VTPEETAAACAAAVSGIAANFMLDPTTYAAGAEQGFSGLDFYAAGRGGVLGQVDADEVAAAFAFFEPSMVRTQWELGTSVMDPPDASKAFIAAGHRWATEHLDADACDWQRLAELQGRVNAAATAATPLAANWRDLPEPDGADARALALHRLHVARELRFALHAAAVQEAGISAPEAMAVRSPHMAGIFGWSELPDVNDELRSRWEVAEAETDRALAPAYATLSEDERTELVELCAAALGAVK
jgi:hypothetical protein